MKCNIKEHYGFSVDIAFVVAYNSAPETVSNPVMKVEIKKDGSQFGGTPVYITNAAQVGVPGEGGALDVNIAQVKGEAASAVGGVLNVKTSASV